MAYLVEDLKRGQRVIIRNYGPFRMRDYHGKVDVWDRGRRIVEVAEPPMAFFHLDADEEADEVEDGIPVYIRCQSIYWDTPRGRDH